MGGRDSMTPVVGDEEIGGLQVSVVVGGEARGEQQDDLKEEQSSPPPDPSVSSLTEEEEVTSIDARVELLSAHDIVSSPNPDSPPPSLEPPDHPDEDDEEDPSATETVMIDASDFRGVLNEPTYQTLNGRMTPPGFAPSSSYATLTPLQPLPPISTMSDKFSHYGHHHHHHHAGNGTGFAIMQNPVTGSYHAQYDKLTSAINSQGVSLAVNVSIGNLPPGHHHQHPTVMMTASNGQVSSHGHNHVIQGNLSSPFHSNGLNSPDKSLSPSNGFEYNSGNGQRVLGSPQSSSSVDNLHSPSSPLQTSLNGTPVSPSAQLPPSPPSSSGQQQNTSSGHIIGHNTQSAFVSSSSPETKVVTSCLDIHPSVHPSSSHPSSGHQRVTVLQANVTPSRAQTVTIVQTPSSGVSNLAAAIVSTPVAVVTTANVIQQQQQNNINLVQNNSHAKQTTGGSIKNSLNSSSRSESSATSGDELEEINTKDLAQRISAELKRYSIPQAIFAQRVLCRSQGTLSDLLRNPKPWSKLKSGRETFRRMSKWLEEPEFQRMSALRLAG